MVGSGTRVNRGCRKSSEAHTRLKRCSSERDVISEHCRLVSLRSEIQSRKTLRTCMTRSPKRCGSNLRKSRGCRYDALSPWPSCPKYPVPHVITKPVSVIADTQITISCEFKGSQAPMDVYTRLKNRYNSLRMAIEDCDHSWVRVARSYQKASSGLHSQQAVAIAISFARSGRHYE